jgi:hypothetical protein
MMERKPTKSALWGRTCLTLCAVVLSASLTFAGAPKISKDLAGTYASGQADVTAQFNQFQHVGNRHSIGNQSLTI